MFENNCSQSSQSMGKLVQLIIFIKHVLDFIMSSSIRLCNPGMCIYYPFGWNMHVLSREHCCTKKFRLSIEQT